MGVITFVSVVIVFLAVTVGLISGSIPRRVMADARAIGMLRAVGVSVEPFEAATVGRYSLRWGLGVPSVRQYLGCTDALQTIL